MHLHPAEHVALNILSIELKYFYFYLLIYLKLYSFYVVVSLQSLYLFLTLALLIAHLVLSRSFLCQYLYIIDHLIFSPLNHYLMVFQKHNYFQGYFTLHCPPQIIFCAFFKFCVDYLSLSSRTKIGSSAVLPMRNPQNFV